MSAKDVTHAKALLADPDITVEEVAKRMNVDADSGDVERCGGDFGAC
jgi:hypothetical protein